MNKKIFALILSLVFALSFLAGCNTGSLGKVNISGRQDTSYVVTSNGGMAVQYGNYVYFINGTRGWEDTDASQNKWGEVVAGALYRAELNGKKVASSYGDNVFDFEIQYNAETEREFKSTLDYVYWDDEEEGNEKQQIVDVEVLAPKTIGTSGFAGGGIFIFDNAAYYASPNNEKSKQGEVLYNRTDFYRTTLDGQSTVRLYTTENDTANMPYTFYNQGGYVYLVVFDNPNVVSVKTQGTSVKDTKILSKEATDVYLPAKPVYYNGIDTNGLEDYVYITRNYNEDDQIKSGTVIEVMRPDGTERVIVRRDGTNASIEAVRDGMLFFRTTQVATPVILFTNLHDILMDLPDNIPQSQRLYQKHQESLPADKRNRQLDGVAMNVPNLSDFTSTYAFRPNTNSNIVYVLAVNSSGLWMYKGDTEVSSTPGYKVVSGTVNLGLVDGNYVYYTTDSTEYYRTNMFLSENENDAPQKLTGAAAATSSFSVDLCAGYLVYYANLDEWATRNYTFFQKVNGLEGVEPVFVGVRAEDDMKPEEDK